MSLLAFVLFVVGAAYEAFEELYEFSRAHEDWELDELVIAFMTAGIAGLIFFVRRSSDLAREIRLRNQAERDSAWLACHDPLTKLPNRRGLDQHIDRLTHDPGADQDGRMVAYAIGLDGFKAVNDLLGHNSGDIVLTEIARRIDVAAEGAFCARLGGDEFVVLSRRPDTEAAQEFARDLVHMLCTPLSIAGVEAEVGASIGVAVLGEDAHTIPDLMRAADTAMYSAKRDGRNLVCRYRQEMGISSQSACGSRRRCEMRCATAL